MWFSRAWRDSNPRHLVPKTSALSTELQALMKKHLNIMQFSQNLKKLFILNQEQILSVIPLSGYPDKSIELKMNGTIGVIFPIGPFTNRSNAARVCN